VGVHVWVKSIMINTAYQYCQYFEEKVKGSLEIGKVADLVILDKNPLKVDPLSIRDIKVVETIKEGKTIFLAQ
jgi:predicted amidohydrolase YtcJ